MISGIIIKGIGGFYYVTAGNCIYECKARGVFRKNDLAPLPGDRVCMSIIDEQKKKGNIEQIMPRSSILVRPAVANINQVITVIAAKSPEPDFLLLDKLLITAEIKCIEAVICINKIDLVEKEQYEKITGYYSKSGYKVLLSSSKMNIGFEQLKHTLKGRISVFAGQSGVGKSTILNIIMNSRVMQTGEMSEKIDRGRHTTRHAELIELDTGGYVADTPGFSSFELENISCNELQLYYPEFSEHINTCKYTGCSHISEPECKVKVALEKGSIDTGRYERYIKLYNELKDRKEDYRGRSRKNEK